MALVMLPCDLPWWSNICKRLTLLQQTDDTYVILEIMLRIHDLCNVSLDPDEDKRDATIFDGLKNHLLHEMTADECQHFKTVTLRNLAKRAQSLKALRPPRGLSFSLQQQPDKVKLNYDLVAALLANAFFSTFPKRTEKTHPTLQDFNFTYFFRKLNENHQKVKFQSFIKYFDWLEVQATQQSTADQKSKEKSNGGIDVLQTIPDETTNTIKISRKVFSGKQWLTIEDWLECTLPLCSLEIKHEGRIERSHENVVQTIFASSRLGGDFLSDGWSQECLEFTIFPELIATLLYVEALEDNEVVLVENLRQINRIMTDSNKRSYLEPLDEPRKISVCLMDAENYSTYPDSQFEEDNVLRELNKCLLAFRQNTTCPIILNNGQRINRRLNSVSSMASDPDTELNAKERERNMIVQRRLSPIGESGRNSPKDITQIIIRQPSTSTKRSSYDSDRIANNIDKRRSWLAASPIGGSSSKDGSSNVPSVVTGPTASGRRGRFIVLGSSGERLPVNRMTAKRQMFANSSQHRTDSNSVYSSCNSSDENDGEDIGDEKYYSARTSFDDFTEALDDEQFDKKYCEELDTVEKRYTFAEKLRDALRHSEQYTESTDDSYAVDISISGSRTDGNEGIRIRRGGSRGFVLTEDSLDEEFYMESLNQGQNWLEKFRNKITNGPVLTNINMKTDNNANVTSDQKSKCSFGAGDSSELSSELEEVYEQFSKWLDDPIIKDNTNVLDPRDEAVMNFASSLLKRTLSESFVGIPLTEGCITSTCIPAEENSMQNYQNKQKNRQIINARSLSLEVAKHKHRLAAQLNNQSETDMTKKSSKKPQSPIVLGLPLPITQPLIKTIEESEATIAAAAAAISTISDSKYEHSIIANQMIGHSLWQPQQSIIPPRLLLFSQKKSSTVPLKRWSITNIQSQQTVKCDEFTVKISQIGKHRSGKKDGIGPVATGNWGCGSLLHGDVQLKLVIQWMAASLAGLPVLVYYTSGHEKLAKLDTVCRVLLDRKWTVGELAAATLEYAKDILDCDGKTTDATIDTTSRCLFEKLIGI